MAGLSHAQALNTYFARPAIKALYPCVVFPSVNDNILCMYAIMVRQIVQSANKGTNKLLLLIFQC